MNVVEQHPQPSPQTRQNLADFLSRNRDRAIAQWERAVRAIPAAALLDPQELRDHIPALLDRVLEVVQAGRVAASPAARLPDLHAIQRMQEGFSLEQIAWEYSALRSTLLRLNHEEGNTLLPEALVLLNDAIDEAVVEAITKYHEARLRTLSALDRIAHEGLVAEPEALDALLHRLLQVILETTEAVDLALLYLREWDRLVVRAVAGIEEPLAGFSVPLGEGLAGAVAASKQPVFTRAAAQDPRMRNDALHEARVRALYAVPLVYGDDVIGVVMMGSRTAADFAVDDRQILRSTAERAAAFIAQRRVADDRELFLHVLGHDLRSPLSTIVFGAEALARREALSPAAARTLQRMTGAAQRMESVIATLADYTLTQATGTLPLNREAVDLHALLRQLAGELQSQHPDRELRLELTGDGAGEWDRGRLQRVLANLVNNALAYGAPSTPVTIAVGGDEDRVTVSVHNEGTPIAPELVPHLFEPFKRGSSGVGMGLGLYVVQQVARAHGGDVEVDSAPARGTTFRVRLPRRAAGDGSTPQSAARPRP